MIEGTAIFAIIIPFMKPITMPTAILHIRATITLPVLVNTREKIYPQKAIMPGKDRSISPAVIIYVNPMAMISVNGTVDRKAI
jgi:hypothetical protein